MTHRIISCKNEYEYKHSSEAYLLSSSSEPLVRTIDYQHIRTLRLIICPSQEMLDTPFGRELP